MSHPQTALPTFSRVIGGELPLSPDEAELWLAGKENDLSSLASVCELWGGEGKVCWLRYGRSALGAALGLCNIQSTSRVALPAYQCVAVVNKISSYTRNWTTYGLDEFLIPDSREFLELARTAHAVITCVYFGSRRIESRLQECVDDLRNLQDIPWIIEDRVMCFPDLSCLIGAEERCDFALLSFRKHYPVPDGALLVACSERAREALGDQSRACSFGRLDAQLAIRKKVRAKVKRHAWLSASPFVDDPLWNARNESVVSEMYLDSIADSKAIDFLPGTTASARYILERDLVCDAHDVRRWSRVVVDGVRSIDRLNMTVNVEDCCGIGVPLLVANRDAFKAVAAENGIFLPVHWPRYDENQVCLSVQFWYMREVTVPIASGGSEDDIVFLLDMVARFCRELTEFQDS
tara:strand:- start:1092 stop:2312 length:1221 start_codon:yes stop_codon:yes gene_type:complete